MDALSLLEEVALMRTAARWHTLPDGSPALPPGEGDKEERLQEQVLGFMLPDLIDVWCQGLTCVLSIFTQMINMPWNI